MSEEEKVEGYYQARAKEFVDILFDKGYFREDVSRDGMNGVEDVLALIIQMQCKSAVVCATLVKGIKE